MKVGRSIDVLDVLEEWIMINGKPNDNGKQFTSKIFKRFLEHNNIKDKPIPNSYPHALIQLQTLDVQLSVELFLL
jgi:transposase InsO family protein